MFNFGTTSVISFPLSLEVSLLLPVLSLLSLVSSSDFVFLLENNLIMGPFEPPVETSEVRLRLSLSSFAGGDVYNNQFYCN